MLLSDHDCALQEISDLTMLGPATSHRQSFIKVLAWLWIEKVMSFTAPRGTTSPVRINSGER